MSHLQAYENLRTGLLASESTPREDGYRVVGNMGNRWIRLEAVPPGVRNAFRPVARMRLESLSPGSRLAGTVRVPLLIRVFSLVWIGLAGCGAILATGVAADQVVTGHAEWADVLFVLVPAGLIVFFVALTSWGVGSGRDDTRYLRGWLAERLRATGES